MIFIPPPGLGEHEPSTHANVCWEEMRSELRHTSQSSAEQLEAHLGEIESRVARYVEVGGDPKELGPSPFPRQANTKAPMTVGDILYDRYRSGQSTDQDIVRAVSEPLPTHCPYCGSRMRRKVGGRAYDRDHILPRSKYPEFSVLRLNIVPLCDICNEAKGNACLDTKGEWQFLHPYFDRFLTQNVVSAVARVEDGAILIAFAPAADVPSHARERVARHMSALDLATRMFDEAIDYVILVLRQYVREPGEVVDGDLVRKVIADCATASLAERPNDPVGLALQAISRGDIDALIRVVTP